MWQLDNRTPFAAERTWTRARNGAEIWLVAVKGTFDLTADGRTTIAADQPPVTQIPVYTNAADPARSSLRYDIDLVRTKTTTDVILLGHAYAPEGVPAAFVDVELRVGSLTKRLRVTGDRVWRNGSISSPQTFTKMPMVYERAYGGFDPSRRDAPSPEWDVRNPVGTGFALSSSALDGVPLPNIEYVDQLITRAKHRPAPAGFGPICAHWHARAQFAGTYDKKWEQERLPLLPDDFDDRYFQCAPLDQQTTRYLVGGEPVTILGLTPDGHLSFNLPRVALELNTSFYRDSPRRNDPPQLHSVILEPDGPRVSLVWHSALPCHPQVYQLKTTRITAVESSAGDA